MCTTYSYVCTTYSYVCAYVESPLAGTVKITDIEDLDPIFLELET